MQEEMMAHETECAVCLIEHDEELHEATLRVKTWFRYEVTLGFFEEQMEVQEEIEAA
jgi:hypothetical protein